MHSHPRPNSSESSCRPCWQGARKCLPGHSPHLPGPAATSPCVQQSGILIEPHTGQQAGRNGVQLCCYGRSAPLQSGGAAARWVWSWYVPLPCWVVHWPPAAHAHPHPALLQPSNAACGRPLCGSASVQQLQMREVRLLADQASRCRGAPGSAARRSARSARSCGRGGPQPLLLLIPLLALQVPAARHAGAQARWRRQHQQPPQPCLETVRIQAGRLCDWAVLPAAALLQAGHLHGA